MQPVYTLFEHQLRRDLHLLVCSTQTWWGALRCWVVQLQPIGLVELFPFPLAMNASMLKTPPEAEFMSYAIHKSWEIYELPSTGCPQQVWSTYICRYIIEGKCCSFVLLFVSGEPSCILTTNDQVKEIIVVFLYFVVGCTHGLPHFHRQRFWVLFLYLLLQLWIVGCMAGRFLILM